MQFLLNNMYKRNEPFRFEFPEPIDCFFTILTPNNESKESNKGEIKMLNLSQKGCRFSSHLQLPADGKWYITIEAILNSHTLLLSGHIVWKKTYSSSSYIYGFKFDEDHDYSSLITAEVKQFSSDRRNGQRTSG